MIDKMHKVIFYGISDSVEAFMKRAQQVGSCQFFCITKQPLKKPSIELEKAHSAIKLLQKQPVQKQETLAHSKCQHMCHKIINHHHLIQTYCQELKQLRREALKVGPFGYFNLDDVHQIEKDSGKFFQFFIIRHTKLSALEKIPEELLFVAREKEFDYFLSIENAKVTFTDFYEVQIERTKCQIELRIQELEDLIKAQETALKESARYTKALQSHLVEMLNECNLAYAIDDVQLYLEGDLFALDAWVPDSKVATLKEIASNFDVSVSFIAIEKTDTPPTYVKNKGFFGKTGQDLVTIYDTPSLKDRDPSKWVVAFFSLFFAIIVSDAGYGAIFLIASIILLRKFKNKASATGIRAMKLFRAISIVTIVWGVLVGSYFSIAIEPTSKLNKFNMLRALAVKKIEYHSSKKDAVYKEWIEKYPDLVDVVDANTIIQKGVKISGGVKKYAILNGIYNSLLLEFALLLGVLHLSISFLRNLFRDYSGIGWVIALWGGFFAFSTLVHAVTVFSYVGSMSIDLARAFGFDMLYGGLSIAMILSVIQNGWYGILALQKPIEIFADVLSYLRLYALGLASMVMAETFNDIALMTGSYIFGALICFGGHIINMGLAVMAGVIHGLRLNFLEWYRHSFEGGGTRFYPLKILTNPSYE